MNKLFRHQKDSDNEDEEDNDKDGNVILYNEYMWCFGVLRNKIKT